MEVDDVIEYYKTEVGMVIINLVTIFFYTLVKN
jgi:hypothetical protein